MLMVAIVVVGLAVVPLTGGSLRRLGDIRLSHSWLIFVGLGLQLVVTTVLPDLPVGPSQVIHVASYLFILGFVVANWRRAGIKVIGLGTILNFAAIVSNHGTMPARAGALRTAGIVLTHKFENSAPVAHAHLHLLGDIFAVPASFPLANVFSVGDVLIDIGALLLIIQACRTKPEAVGDHGGASGLSPTSVTSCVDGWLGQLQPAPQKV